MRIGSLHCLREATILKAADFAESLNPYVQEKFRELQSAAMLDEHEP